MPAVDPSIYLRLGSHSEKDYFEKVIRYLDGYIIAANLIESTPAACASLVFRFSGERKQKPYLLDPMTYAFGAYTDPSTGKIRHDLDWIKSEQKRKKQTIRDFKRSYKKLGEEFGGLFAKAVGDSEAISPLNIRDDAIIKHITNAVISYQRNRIPEIFREEMKEDPEAGEMIKEIPLPFAIIAPYFYIEPSDEASWLDVNLRLMRATVLGEKDLPVHGVLCVDRSMLKSQNKLESIARELVQTKIKGVWLWLSKLNEEESTANELSGLKYLVNKLSSDMEVYNMHGGYFSLALSRFGMKGISHGVGYGEQKDVVPVIGQSLPVVRYYLPDLHRRLGVPDIQRCFHSMEIKEPDNFYEQICDCAICKGVVSNNTDQFGLFGEMQPPKPGKNRSTQTPAAAKRCRFHFLLNRVRERDKIKNITSMEIGKSLLRENEKWRNQRSVERYCQHLLVWNKVLNGDGH